MSDPRFPKLEFKRPQKLIGASTSIVDYDLDPIPGREAHLWDRLLWALQKGLPLNNSQILAGMLSFQKIPTTLQQGFVTKARFGMSKKVFDRASQHAFSDLADWILIGLLFDVGEKLCEESEKVPLTVKTLQKKAGKLSTDALIDLILSSPSPLRLISESKVADGTSLFSNGQRSIIDSLLVRKRTNKLFIRGQAEELIALLWNGFGDVLSFATRMEKILANYIGENPAWKTELLSETQPVGVFIRWFEKQSGDVQSRMLQFKTIQEIRAELELFKRVLDELEKKSPGRASFWRERLENSLFVYTKSFRGKVGVAFRFGKSVIVEFGPEGNAAYVYDAEVFETKIRSTNEWRRPEFGRTISGFTDSTYQGSIRHTEGWQAKMNILINLLSGEG